jgi:hypothetical protein
MPGLTPACGHVKQSLNWDGPFCPILLTTQIWHPPTATCLALSEMYYVDVILQMTTNWNIVFVMCSEVEEGNFTLVYSVLLRVGESVLKMTETLEK